MAPRMHPHRKKGRVGEEDEWNTYRSVPETWHTRSLLRLGVDEKCQPANYV